MATRSNKWQTAARKASQTSRWAKIMTKWLISRNRSGGAMWHVVNFLGPGNSESRGVVDLLAVRKNHREHNDVIKRGDLFDIVLIQVKGGGAVPPTLEDIGRLIAVAKHHRAKAIVLCEWKRRERLQLYALKRNKWMPIQPREIF